MKKGDLLRRGNSKGYALVRAVPCSGGVVLSMIPARGAGVYYNPEVYSIDLLGHFGWRVVGGVDHV